jgi:hypothetical protein
MLEHLHSDKTQDYLPEYSKVEVAHYAIGESLGSALHVSTSLSPS